MTRRWNGWGDDATVVELAPSAAAFLADLVGPGLPRADASLATVVASVPLSRLPAHPLVALDPLDRVLHARGQSLPDWIARRSGRIGAVPDGVARPGSRTEVRALLAYAAAAGATVIPYGGGTGVVGGTTPGGTTPGGTTPGGGSAPVLTIALERLAGIDRLDERSALATVGAGTTGPALESALAAHGLRLGHYPQSWELSTVGGWVATRSTGQQSLGYGRIEALFAGGVLEAPAGTIELPPHPASAAGPDLRQLVLGSEGRLGIVTEATLRVAPLPEAERTIGLFLPTLASGIDAARAIATARVPLVTVRLSTPAETRTTLTLAGRPGATTLLARYLRLRGLGPERCLLILGAAGTRRRVAEALREATGIAGHHGAIGAPGNLGGHWFRERFRTPYLRNALWEAGYAVDTVETAIEWSETPALIEALAPALRRGLVGEGERVHAFTHLSHVYPTGTSLYTTYLYRLAQDPDQTLQRWSTLKRLASEAIVAAGGTISHQHGVGRDHRPYLASEKGELGISLLGAVADRLDPDGRMNPGVLIP